MVRVVVLLAALLTATSAFAQDEDSLADASAGYALGRSAGMTGNGWYGEVAARTYRSLYAVAGVSGSYFSDTSKTKNGKSIRTTRSSFSIGGGPRFFFSYRRSAVNPFVDVLLSYRRVSTDSSNIGSSSVGFGGVKGFGLDILGGTDFSIHSHFSIRVRPGYSMTKAGGETENGFALLVGMVFHVRPVGIIN